MAPNVGQVIELTLKVATTRSKLSPLLKPAEAYLCKMAKISVVIEAILSFNDGNSYLKIHVKH